MSLSKQSPINGIDSSEKHWKSLLLLGSITAVISILGTLLDIIIGSSTGGDLMMAIPQTSIHKFTQLNHNPLLGLYNLDLLNVITTILMIPTYFALIIAHRKGYIGYVLLAAVIYYIGAIVFITNNTALPMLELARKYATTLPEAHKAALAGAGEAMLARGAHGSPGAFPGFILSTLGSFAMSFGMLKGKVFSRLTAYIGLLGSTLLLIYVVLVTFVPSIKDVAVMVAAPGGILALIWTIMYTIKLFKLGLS